ncbi:MAG: hypothetical protein ACK50Q_12360 [Labrys sp. (in: a-proteobacteria)]
MSRSPFIATFDGDSDEERARVRALQNSELLRLLDDRTSRCRLWAQFGDKAEEWLKNPDHHSSQYRSVTAIFDKFGADPRNPYDWLMILSALSDAFTTGKPRGRPSKPIPGTPKQQDYALQVLLLSAEKGIPESVLIRDFAGRLKAEQGTTEEASHRDALTRIVKFMKATGYVDRLVDFLADRKNPEF